MAARRPEDEESEDPGPELVASLAASCRENSDYILNRRGIVNLTSDVLRILNKQLPAINYDEEFAPASEDAMKAKGDLEFLFEILQLALRVKITPNALPQDVEEEKGPIVLDVGVFRSLRALYLSRVDISLIKSLSRLRTQLKVLCVQRCLEGRPLLHLLGKCGYDKEKEQPWTTLEELDCSSNEIPCLDRSLRQLPMLQVLDLGANDIYELTDDLQYLESLMELSLSDNHISSLKIFGEATAKDAFANLTHLRLAHNSISSLTGLQILASLELLDLSNNCISRFGEIGNLIDFGALKDLFLEGNLFEGAQHWRLRVFASLPKTWRRIALDGKRCTDPFEEVLVEHYINKGPDSPPPIRKSLPLTQPEDDSGPWGQRGSGAQAPVRSGSGAVGVDSASHRFEPRLRSISERLPDRPRAVSETMSEPKLPSPGQASVSRPRRRKEAVIRENDAPPAVLPASVNGNSSPGSMRSAFSERSERSFVATSTPLKVGSSPKHRRQRKSSQASESSTVPEQSSSSPSQQQQEQQQEQHLLLQAEQANPKSPSRKSSPRSPKKKGSGTSSQPSSATPSTKKKKKRQPLVSESLGEQQEALRTKIGEIFAQTGPNALAVYQAWVDDLNSLSDKDHLKLGDMQTPAAFDSSDVVNGSWSAARKLSTPTRIDGPPVLTSTPSRASKKSADISEAAGRIQNGENLNDTHYLSASEDFTPVPEDVSSSTVKSGGSTRRHSRQGSLANISREIHIDELGAESGKRDAPKRQLFSSAGSAVPSTQPSPLKHSSGEDRNTGEEADEESVGSQASEQPASRAQQSAQAKARGSVPLVARPRILSSNSIASAGGSGGSPIVEEERQDGDSDSTFDGLLGSFGESRPVIMEPPKAMNIPEGESTEVYFVDVYDRTNQAVPRMLQILGTRAIHVLDLTTARAMDTYDLGCLREVSIEGGRAGGPPTMRLVFVYSGKGRILLRFVMESPDAADELSRALNIITVQNQASQPLSVMHTRCLMCDRMLDAFELEAGDASKRRCPHCGGGVVSVYISEDPARSSAQQAGAEPLSEASTATAQSHPGLHAPGKSHTNSGSGSGDQIRPGGRGSRPAHQRSSSLVSTLSFGLQPSTSSEGFERREVGHGEASNRNSPRHRDDSSTSHVKIVSPGSAAVHPQQQRSGLVSPNPNAIQPSVVKLANPAPNVSKEDLRTLDRAVLPSCVPDCRKLDTNLRVFLSLEHMDEGEEIVGAVETQFVHREGMNLSRILRTLCVVTNKAFKIFWRHTEDGLYFRYNAFGWRDLVSIQLGLGMQSLRFIFENASASKTPIRTVPGSTSSNSGSGGAGGGHAKDGRSLAHVELRTDNEWHTKSFLTLVAELPEIYGSPLFWSDRKLISAYCDVISELSAENTDPITGRVGQLGQGSGRWDKVEAGFGIISYMRVKRVEGADASKFAACTLILTRERVYLSTEQHEWHEDRNGEPAVRMLSSQAIVNITSLGYSRLNDLDLQLILSQEDDENTEEKWSIQFSSLLALDKFTRRLGDLWRPLFSVDLPWVDPLP